MWAEHAFYKDSERAQYVTASDKDAIDAFLKLSKVEGIIPAIESSHAVSYGLKLASELDKDKIIIICLSGRGDKDVAEIARILGKVNYQKRGTLYTPLFVSGISRSEMTKKLRG